MGDPRSEIGGSRDTGHGTRDDRVLPSPLRRLVSHLSPLLLLAAPLAAQSSVPWLVGCWTTGTTNESWVRRADGRLLGIGYTVFPDSLHRTETLELVAEHDELEYRARPEGATTTTVFRAEVVTADSLVVTNPAHDFPQRIGYRRLPEGRMVARIDGQREGAARAVEFPMRRTACP